MNSTKNNLKILPNFSPVLTSKNHRITKANTLLLKSSTIDHNQQDLKKKIIFNSQIDLSSKTTDHQHIQCVTNQPSVSNFKSLSMTDFNPDISIKDSHNNSHDQILIYSSNPNLLSEDEDDRELLENIKTFVDQASQAIIENSKAKKKTKSSHSKKIKSNLKREKQPNGIQIPPSTLSLSNRIIPNGDSTSLATSTKSSAKTEENNGTKKLITVDTSKARSNLEAVRLCIRELGWKECSYNTTLDSDIYWHSSSYHEGNATFAFNSGRVNKFPGINDLLRKVHLTRSLNNMRLLFPNEYNFYPKTWFLPEQNQQFKDDVRYMHYLDKKHNRSLTTFIVKPSDGSQGEGIYLIRDPSHIITTNRPHVIQEYIQRPLLINGLKFDLRIYVLILNLYPLEIYLYDEGLVRFATIDYKIPSTENLHETFMHLTNYSLNKRSSNYKHTVDEKQTDGSKRKLTLVWKELSQMFGNEKIERTKNLITELINKTILAIVPELRIEYEFELPLEKREHLSCFQIVGFDIILTDQLKPILLEVNANPSLRIDFDKENEAGKLVYQPSLIDEEIKKPLILETLKLALPKKKLNTIARHAQIQADDEIMAQRFEKVAQRRVDQRNEKLKSARKTRFDMRLNPFFSRPLQSIAKEFVRQQQEQQQIEQKRHQHSSPTHPLILARSNEPITAYTQFTNHDESIKSVRKLKKLHYATDDDNESGLPTTISLTETIKRSGTKSILSRPTTTTTDTTMNRPLDNLKLIFPSNHKTKYQHLFLIDQISHIYIQLVVILGYKTMTGGQFRNFANICGIMSETITAPSIDILYYQMLKKWQQFVARTTLTGLPFAAFIETFFLLSQRKFPNAHNLFDSVNQLVDICIRHLNPTLQTPISPLMTPQNQYLLHRTAKNNTNTTHSSSLNIRPNISTIRSSTTLSINRSGIIVSSTPLSKDHQIISATPTIDDSIKQRLSRQSTKSVFPLFFDVL